MIVSDKNNCVFHDVFVLFADPEKVFVDNDCPDYANLNRREITQ